MVRNSKDLLNDDPIKGMLTHKVKFNGVSHGLSEAGYDITIGQNIYFYKTLSGKRKVAVESQYGELLHKETGRFVLASAQEKFQMPSKLVGVVHDKSSWAREGLSVFNTVVEPSWHGYLTLELVYHGEDYLHIPYGTGIAQVLFHSLSQPGYYDGKYQNQSNKPVKAIKESSRD